MRLSVPSKPLPHALGAAFQRSWGLAVDDTRALGSLLAPHVEGPALQCQCGPEEDDAGPDADVPDKARKERVLRCLERPRGAGPSGLASHGWSMSFSTQPAWCKILLTKVNATLTGWGEGRYKDDRELCLNFAAQYSRETQALHILPLGDGFGPTWDRL